MLAKECMTKNVELGRPDMTVQEAARLMRDGDFGSLPINDNDRLAGMVTDRDIVIRAVADGKDLASLHVRDIMSSKVLYCYEDQTLEEIAANLGDNQIRRLPVLNREKRLVGILSIGDLAISKTDANQFEQAVSRIAQHTNNISDRAHAQI